jgi:predicted nucleotidyltransferase
VELLMQCNPNIIEMLGVREEDILYLSPLGRTIRDSRDLFLSKRVADSFGGYALSQRRKLENAAARNDIPEALKQEHTLGSMKHSSRHFQDYLRTPGHENDYLKLSLNNNPAIVADVHLTAVPVSDFKMVLQELSEVQKSYAIPLPEKSDSAYAKINKNAMHLVRLYLMATEILEKHEINTYRAKEHDLLMSIRSGEYRAYDGTMLPSYWKLVDDLEQKFKAAKAASTLPDKPNFKRIEQLVMDVSRQSI